MSNKQNPADKVEQWPIGSLIPYAKNSRTHSDEQVAQIAASIKEWGFTTAVLVDELGSIIAGPKGQTGLNERNWICGDCGCLHDRDVNAALNILFRGYGHVAPAQGIPVL